MEWYKEGYNEDFERKEDFAEFTYRQRETIERMKHHPISIIRKLLSWKTKDGQVILIHDLKDNHLQNIIRHLRNSTAGEKGDRLRILNTWLDVMVREHKYRSEINSIRISRPGNPNSISKD